MIPEIKYYKLASKDLQELKKMIYERTFTMTWEELKEEAIAMGGMEFFNIHTGSEHFEWRGLKFYDIGIVKQADGSLLAKNKTPDQMYQIMLALR